MMKKAFLIFCLTAILGSLCGCGEAAEFYPTLAVVGDVEQAISFTAAENDFTAETIEYGGNKYSAYKLQDILSAAKPKNTDSKVYFVAADGMMASIDYKDVGENYIAFTEKGWEALNDGFPPSADVKEMKRIVVVDNAEAPEYALHMTKADGTAQVITCGRLLIANRQIINTKEGSNEKGGHAVSVFTGKEGYYIPDCLDISADSLVMLTDAAGKSAYYYADGCIAAAGNALNYVSADGKDEVLDVRGVSLQAQ